MNKLCKVEFIPTVDYLGGLKGNKYYEQLDIAREMESLIEERMEQGFQLVNVKFSKRVDDMGRDTSGFFLFFVKK